MATTPETPQSVYVGYVPAEFTRHLHRSLDDVALCGARSHAQGTRTAAPALVDARTCTGCATAATS